MGDDDSVTNSVIGMAIKVHRCLGPGLLESVYEACLCSELGQAGLPYRRQAAVPVVYGDIRLPRGFRADIIVGQEAILEIKSVERILPLHEAQMLTYLRLSGCRVGLLLNFNTLLLKDGIRRFIP